MASSPNGRPLIVLGRASPVSLERLEPAGVDELKAGQVDDYVPGVARLCIELAVKQSRGGVIERASQPEDQYLLAALRAVLDADSERGDGGPPSLSAWRQLATTRHYVCLSLVHAAPSVGLTHETITGG